jgi:hypothetical protein
MHNYVSISISIRKWKRKGNESILFCIASSLHWISFFSFLFFAIMNEPLTQLTTLSLSLSHALSHTHIHTCTFTGKAKNKSNLITRQIETENRKTGKIVTSAETGGLAPASIPSERSVGGSYTLTMNTNTSTSLERQR